MIRLSAGKRLSLWNLCAGKHSGERGAVEAILGKGFAGGSTIYARHKIEDSPRRNHDHAVFNPRMKD